MKINFATLLLSSAMLVLVACSSSDDDGDVSSQINTPVTDADPNVIPLESRYNGNYISGCEDDGDGIWIIQEFSLQEASTFATTTVYADSECTQTIRVVTANGLIELPGGTANTSLGVADFANLNLEAVFVDGVEFTDAETGVIFGLLLLDGNNLHFGLFTDELDGETADTRPIEIDENSALMRI